MVAFAKGYHIGIDVERLRPDRPWKNLAQRFFDPLEMQQIEDVPPEEQESLFYQLWTLKEAMIKCMGLSIFTGLPRARFDAQKNPPTLLNPNEEDKALQFFHSREPHYFSIALTPFHQDGH